MAPPSEKEKSEISARILQGLSETPYACSQLTALTNGTTNFVFRGTLVQPLPAQDGTSTVGPRSVIIKHSTDFVAVNKDFPLDISRCVSISRDPRPRTFNRCRSQGESGRLY